MIINLKILYQIKNIVVLMIQNKIKRLKPKLNLVFKVLDYVMILNFNRLFKNYLILNLKKEQSNSFKELSTAKHETPI